MKVIFFDALGTLFGVRGSVGQMYRQVALEFGVELDAGQTDRCFIEAFRGAPPMVFPNSEAISAQEYEWWYQLVQATFARSGDYDKFKDFAEFFRRLYQFFATSSPWEVYPDVPDSLAKLRSMGYKLGIISNFDSRLFSVLDALSLTDWFDEVVISSLTGSAKPDRGIFDYALHRLQISAPEALHVGDSYKEDYEGAIGAGLSAFWLQRPQQSLFDLIPGG